MSVENGCEINYCVKMGAFASQSAFSARLPPFRKPPKTNVNDSEALILIGREYFWEKYSDGEWMAFVMDQNISNPTTSTIVPTETIMYSPTVFPSSPSSVTQTTTPATTEISNSSPIVLILSFVIAALVIVILVFLVLFCTCCKRKQLKQVNSGETQPLTQVNNGSDQA